MSKHTTGPWVIRNGSDIFTPLGAANAEGIEAPSNDGWMIADCDMGSLSFDEVTANARLIAAAPDLLEALIQAEERLCVAEYHLDRGEDDSIRFESEILDARAAIAKARGDK